MKALNLLLLLPTICWINPVHGQPGENIARGKKYTLDPRPNYQYCTDAGDHVQLTDGIYSKGYFWTQTSTVGWSRAHPVTITIDLEVTQPICGVSFNTAAGVAGVHWPLLLLKDQIFKFGYPVWSTSKLPIAFSPDGTRVVTSSGDQINILDTSIGARLLTLGSQSRVLAVAFSGNGQRMSD